MIKKLRELGAWPGELKAEPDEAHAEQEAEREREQQRRAAFIERTWRQVWDSSSPARHSPIEQWLQARGVHPDRLEVDRLPLRWAPRCPLGKGGAPAMLGLMTDPCTNEPVGIHRTFLLPDGSAKAPIENPRQMLGRAGIIRLTDDAEVELGLGICESIETGLAVMAAGWRPIWACSSLGGLRRFPVLAGIEHLSIFADPKPHEIDGARECARRWAARGKEAQLRIPNSDGDWNDLLLEEVL